MEQENRRRRYRGGNSAALLDPGLLAGRYEAGPVLGRGGMSEVRDGWDLKLSRPVAIKLLHSDGRPEDRLRFAAEGRAAANLSGQHIVIVHDVGEHDGVPFIVMERLPGLTLADHIARGPLEPAFVHRVLDNVLAALAIAHNAGIVHRDVKPGNVLFTDTGQAKLADFGIAKIDGGVHTRTGEIIGSVAYLSPDRLTSKPATPTDDLYALGVVAYEALAGRRPFPQTALGPLTHAILHDKPLPIADVRHDVPAGLSIAIERALSRNPAQRFTRAEAMRAALVDTEPTTAPVPTPVRSPTFAMQAPQLPPSGTNPIPAFEPDPAPDPAVAHGKLWLAALIAAFLLAILLIVVIEPFSSTPPPPSPSSTTSPLPPPPAATTATTEPAISSAPAQPPAPPPGHHGKKPKGAKGN